MGESILICSCRRCLPLPPIEGEKNALYKGPETMLLRRPILSGVDRCNQCCELCLGCRLGEPAQALRSALPVLSPPRYPSAAHFLQTTFLKPFTHVLPPCV